MPGPPPPPPPGGPPPMMPPPPPVFSSGKGGPDNRSALLQSIRKGTNLKKTVTVDKSAPMIAVPNQSVSSTKPSGGASQSNSTPMPNGMGLGGLFANGMPKLRPTGRQIGAVNKSNSGYSANVSSSITKTDSSTSSNRNFSDIQSELKKQMASDNRNRGPPPPAPIRNNTDDIHRQPYMNKNGSSNGLNHNSSSPNINMAGLHSNSSTLHRKAASNVNLSSLDSPDASHNNNLPSKPVINHGKPNLAPKPPALNGKPAAPPKKLVINGKPIGRAQSMKSPRSPSPQSPDNNNPKFGTVRNLSSMLNQSLGHSTGNLSAKPRPPLNGRPNGPPPSIPNYTPPHSASHSPSPSISMSHQATPPLPPSKVNMVKPPNHAPPPPPTAALPQPPSQAPPPPPHRTNHQPSRLPPAIPVNAPPPPPRHSSIRDGAAGRRTSSPTDLDARFADMFHSVNEFPKPPPFRRVPKVYSSKQVGNKQQAPLPPNHLQLSNNRLWDSSTC